ncbi:hypothetical protein DFJ74DRAFT_706844 [Hyaloraphidium curvatum]|nr:hypothetical protein DFJ74DRAFT_706844 [Hyaloraphidium curvatum]
MSFPIAVVQRSGPRLDVMVMEHADRFFVVVNEGIGAFGSIISARWDRPSSARFDAAEELVAESRTCDVRVVLGTPDDPLAHVYASRILDEMAKARPTDDRTLLLSLALRRSPAEPGLDAPDASALGQARETLEEAVNLLRECRLF